MGGAAAGGDGGGVVVGGCGGSGGVLCAASRAGRPAPLPCRSITGVKNEGDVLPPRQRSRRPHIPETSGSSREQLRASGGLWEQLGAKALKDLGQLSFQKHRFFKTRVKCMKKLGFYRHPVKLGQFSWKKQWFKEQNDDFESGWEGNRPTLREGRARK